VIAEGGSPTKICGGVWAPIRTLRDVLVLDSGYAFSSEATRYCERGGIVSVAMPEVFSPREQLAERKGERSVRMQAEKKETGRDVVDTSHNVIKQVV
jgi:hypothetical protein